ncbi:hypothetical protein ABT160_38585 [Streptomyces sp. NPDC001941]|uniref:hypothetical protein n=1 Tax=Streptomyces sp. NPDC001941 TaxID=3154659 RepID=UPI00332F5DB8
MSAETTGEAGSGGDMAEDVLGIEEVAARVVARCAPAEVPYFRVIAEAHFAVTGRGAPPPGTRGASRRVPNGFGVPEALAAATPVVLAVFTGTASDLLASWLRTTADGRDPWRPWRRRRVVVPGTPLAIPSGVDWDVLERQARDAALAAGGTEDLAVSVARAVRAELAALAAPEPPPGGAPGEPAAARPDAEE